MAQSVIKQPRAVMSELKRDYQLDEEEEILAFLEHHPAVVPLLPEIRNNILRYFDNDIVRLDISHDPEWEDDQPELFVNIQTRASPQDALTRLQAFDTEWWLKRLAEAKAPIIVSLHLI